MFFVASFLKQVMKGAAIQLAVQAVVETAWPKVKQATSHIVKKFSDQKQEASELEKLVKDSEDLNKGNQGE